MGYFASLRVVWYRRTRDGRRVCARRTLLPWRRRWFYVTPENAARFELKLVTSQVALLVIFLAFLLIAGERIVDEPRWWTALLVIALLAGSNHWTTAGLPSAEIDDAMLEPLDGAAPTLEAARETAPFTLWVLLIAGLAMTVLQLYVLVTHGVWWSWLGAVMFLLASGVMARQLLRLRTENRVSSARSE